jgi:hypothetical protein
MPLDHYIPQVYLKRFYSKELVTLLHCTRKSDLKSYTPDSKSICRLMNNNTIKYLVDTRGIEAFLKDIEPKYNTVVENIKEKKFGIVEIFVIAGIMSSISTCSPTGIRLGSHLIRDSFEDDIKILDKNNVLPKPPHALEAKSISELIENGKIKVQIDDKFTQASGVSELFSQIVNIGNFDWEILINPFEDNPFFSSDYPICIEKTDDIRVLNKVFPIDPYIAIKIYPDLNRVTDEIDFGFKKNRFRYSIIDNQEVMYINRLIVKCAEDSVFYSKNGEWILPFISKYKKYYLDYRIVKHPNGLVFYSQEIMEHC